MSTTTTSTRDLGRGRTVLVTGASRGLGRSSAAHLASAGFGVVGTYRSNREEADAMLAEVRERGGDGVLAAALQLDTGDLASFGGFVDAVRGQVAQQPGGQADGGGRLHAVVHFAGHGLSAPYAETTAEQLEELLRVHVMAPYLLTQQLLPLLGEGSRVLNVSSGLARFSRPGMSAYASAKGAVEVMTRYQATELGQRGIRVNALVPGAIATDFGGGRIRDDEQANRATAATIPLGRVGEADDIGAAVPLLLADGLGWANGTRVELSGGQSV